MDDYKTLIKRIGLVGIANLLVALSSIILLPILTNNLSIDDYAIWIQFNVSVSLIPIVVVVGLHYSMMRFLPGVENRNIIREGFYSVFFIILFIGSIVATLIYLFSNQLASILFNGNLLVSKILAPAVLIISLNSILLNYFVTFQKMKKYSLFLIIQTYMGVFFVSYLLSSGFGIFGAIIGFLFPYVILAAILFLLIIRDIGFQIPKFHFTKKYLLLALPMVPSDLSFWIIDSLDRYLVGIILGSAFVGYYSPSYTLGKMIMLIISPIMLLLPSALSLHYQKNHMQIVKNVLNYALKIFLFIAVPFTIIISLLSKEILIILSTPEIALNGYIVTPVITLSLLLYGVYSIMSNVLILKNKTRIIGVVWILCAVLNFLVNLCLIPILGIMGAAIATFASYSVALIVMYHYVSKYHIMNFNFNFIFKLLISSLPILLIVSYIQPKGIIELTLTIIISGFVYLASIFILKGFDKEEIALIKKLFGNN